MKRSSNAVICILLATAGAFAGFVVACRAVVLTSDASDAGDAVDAASNASQPMTPDSAIWCPGFQADGKWPFSPDQCTTAEGKISGYWEGGITMTCLQCKPRCDAGKVQAAGGGAADTYLATDLPAGPCPNEGELCDTGASTTWQSCNGVTVGCDLSGVRCECASGQWVCRVTGQGGGTCGNGCQSP